MDGTWLGFMCNVCINILFHCTLSIQRVKGFPTPVWGTSPSTVRLRSLGKKMKSKSATLPQGSSSENECPKSVLMPETLHLILSMELLQILKERLKMCANTQ